MLTSFIYSLKTILKERFIITAIHITNSIIHILNRDMDEPVLNDYELDLSGETYDFLERHIIKSIEDDNTRRGIFKKGVNVMEQVTYKMINNPEYFSEGSKEIARQLFRAMKTNVSIASTDLIVCRYKSDDIDNIGILKMDYSTSFIHDLEVIDGKFKISIKKQDISLPNIGQRIQKCVFIMGDRNNQDYDFIILDNQIGSSTKEQAVAQFFLDTFLDGELVNDNRTLTKLFRKESEEWIQKKEKEGEDIGVKTRTVINTIVHEAEEIDVNSVANELFAEKMYLQEDYIKNLEEKGLSDKKIILDKEWIEKKLNRIKLKTDNNIEIILEHSYFNNNEMFEILSNPNGTKNITIKNIKNIVQK